MKALRGVVALALIIQLSACSFYKEVEVSEVKDITVTRFDKDFVEAEVEVVMPFRLCARFFFFSAKRSGRMVVVVVVVMAVWWLLFVVVFSSVVVVCVHPTHSHRVHQLR